jgi:NAD(P)-dependent dehydrogenase (short-subunit alcohol dehydrogenase family)
MQALIVGTGDGYSASLARKLAGAGHAVALAARDTVKLAALAAETRAGPIRTRTRCSIPTQSPKLPSPPSTSRAAPGRTRSR